MMMNRTVPVFLFGEATPFTHIPYETFSVLQGGDILSIACDNETKAISFMVRQKEVYISSNAEPIYALQVEEW